MKLLDYTTESALLPRQEYTGLGQLIRRQAQALASAGLVNDATLLVRDVLRREVEGGTAMPEGLVIPHARSQAVTQVCLSVATLVKAVPAQGADGEEYQVDLVILLSGPLADQRLLLRVLARLAREVRTGGFLSRLRGAATPGAMAEVLSGIAEERLNGS